MPTTANPLPTQASTERGVSTSQMLVVLAIWFAAAVALASSGFWDDPPRPLLPIIIWTPVLVCAFALRRSASLRDWAGRVDLRWYIGYHLVRIPFGIWFLVMVSDGSLRASVGLPAGYGDIAAGLLAIVAMLAVPVTSARRHRVVWWFNLLALLDILMVFVSVQRVVFTEGVHGVAALTQNFFPVVPVFVVPLILITHGLIFWRLRRLL